jgi:predicted DNA-binding transcriptional regulator AlpA
MRRKDSQLSPPTRKFLNEREVEAIYGIPARTLQKWRMKNARRHGPVARKVGTSVRYSIADIEAWIRTLPTVGGRVAASRKKGQV